MNWQIAGIIFLGIITLFILCCFWAVIEGETHRKREAKNRKHSQDL